MQNLILEIEKAAERAADRTARKIINEIRRTEKKPYADIRKILWMYRDLRLYVDDEQTYIEAYMDDNRPRRSKDVVIWSPGSKVSSEQETHGDWIDRAQINLELSRALIKKIERALDRVVEDDAYFIIEAKYLCETKYSHLAIMDELNISEATLKRRESRVLTRIATFLFGAAALDLEV